MASPLQLETPEQKRLRIEQEKLQQQMGNIGFSSIESPVSSVQTEDPFLKSYLEEKQLQETSTPVPVQNNIIVPETVNTEEIIDAQSDEKMIEITLKDWFTRDDGFWKESVPYEKKVKPQEQTNTESVKAEIEEEVEKIEVKKEENQKKEVKSEYDKQIDELYSEPDVDDGLPF